MPANEFAGECRFALRAPYENLAPETIALGVFCAEQFPCLDTTTAESEANFETADQPFVTAVRL